MLRMELNMLATVFGSFIAVSLTIDDDDVVIPLLCCSWSSFAHLMYIWASLQRWGTWLLRSYRKSNLDAILLFETRSMLNVHSRRKRGQIFYTRYPSNAFNYSKELRLGCFENLTQYCGLGFSRTSDMIRTISLYKKSSIRKGIAMVFCTWVDRILACLKSSSKYKGSEPPTWTTPPRWVPVRVLLLI